MTISVLYVDDETDYHLIVSKFLNKNPDFSVVTCPGAQAALVLLEKRSFDVVVSDYQMPGMDGITLLKEIRSTYGTLPFILFTGRGREEVIIDAVNYGADYYLQKGGDPVSQFTDLVHKIRALYEKRVAENLARENDRRFRKTLDQINMVAFQLDENGIVQYCNDYLLSLTGWTREEFFGRNFFDLAVPPDLRDMKRHLFREALQKQSISQHEEMKILLRTGEIRDLDIINTDLRDEKGNFFGYMCIGEDVTERKKAREEIESWKQRYETLTARSGQVAYEYDIQSDMLILNDSSLKVLGYTPAELLHGKEVWFSLIHPDDYQEVALTFKEAVTESKEFDLAYRIRHKNGKYIWIHIRGYLDQASIGQQKIIGIITDISKEKEAEIALYESEERFRLYLEKAPYIVFTLDARGNFLYVNPVGEKVSGYSATELANQSIFDIVLPDERPLHQKNLQSLLEKGFIHKVITLKTKEDAIIRISMDAVLLAGGEILGFGQDITDYLDDQIKIKEISRKLKLLQTITRHDVMNVITSIKGYMYLLDEEEGAADADRIKTTINGLLKRIEDLIHFSREYEQIGVHSPAWQNVSRILTAIHPSGIPVNSSVPADLALFADPMLDHVFDNLYRNAVSHGDQVTSISCFMEKEADGIRIIWEDNGVGIPPENKEKIFTLGFGKNSGFGLYFISEVLAMTGISITETGTYGKGARFEISVPPGMFRFFNE